LATSVVLHAAILAWALFTIQAQRELRIPDPEPIAVDLVNASDLTRLRQGARNAKQLESKPNEAPKAEPSKKEAPKPTPVAAAPPPPPPPPPEPPKEEPKEEPKKEVASQPGFGQFARFANMALIDRGDPSQAKAALGPVVERLREGYSIAISPEGTRSATPAVGRFKKGAFHMAMQGGVPIVAVVIRNAGELLWRGSRVMRSGTVDVHVRRLRAKLGTEHESMIDTVRGVGYMAVTPPQPQWIVTDPAQHTVRA